MTAPATPAAPAAAAAVERASSPPLRLVVVRTPQPPLDEEHLPLQLVLPGVPAPRPPHRPGPRPRPSTGTDGARVRDGDFGPTWSTRAELPDVREAGRLLVTVALEALAGRRPFAQLRPMTSAAVFTALQGGRRPAWCAGGRAPLLVGAVRVCEPVDGVAEISAVARRNGRAHAVAARLEGIDGRWRCTALQVG
jgi:Family of unknown function (DUF6459)